MRRTTIEKYAAPSGAKPYEDLRRAQRGELQLKDLAGLQHLLDDYFAHADELEIVHRKPRAA